MLDDPFVCMTCALNSSSTELFSRLGGRIKKDFHVLMDGTMREREKDIEGLDIRSKIRRKEYEKRET